MSHFTQHAEEDYARLRTKVDCLDLGLKQADGTPLEHAWLKPMTAGHHVMLDRKLGSNREGDFEMGVFEYFLLAATDEKGARLFDKLDREQLPYRIPKHRLNKVLSKLIEAMRNDFDDYLDEEKENFDEADLPASATASLKG